MRETEGAAGIDAMPLLLPQGLREKKLGAKGFTARGFLVGGTLSGSEVAFASRGGVLGKSRGGGCHQSSLLSPLPVLFKSTPISITKVLPTGKEGHWRDTRRGAVQEF